jgi:SAM-dependent methyltransferase
MSAVSYPAPIEQVMTPYDLALVRERRSRLLARAKGRVLELGGAGGVNLEHYSALAVTEVVVTGASGVTRSRIERAASVTVIPVTVDDQAVLDGPFDTVVAVFTLSGRPDLDGELRRVAALLGPAGQLLFLDHSPRRPGGLTAELSRPFWRVVGGGFVPGRDVPAALRRCGFAILALDRFSLPTLTLPLRSCVAGVARLQRPDGVRRPKATKA